MFDQFKNAAFSVVGAIVVLAIIAVILSRRSPTQQVITAVTSELTKVVRAAVNNPVTNQFGAGDTGLNVFSFPSITN